MIEKCGCADASYPTGGKAFGSYNVKACDTNDVEQGEVIKDSIKLQRVVAYSPLHRVADVCLAVVATIDYKFNLLIVALPCTFIMFIEANMAI